MKVKVKARTLVLHGGRVLLELRSGETGRLCLRPIGGNVEFGEKGAETVAREFCEETGLHLSEIQFLGCIEDVDPGKTWHEICLLYAARIVESQAYLAASLPIREEDGRAFTAYWLPITALQSDTELRCWANAQGASAPPEIRPNGLSRWIGPAPAASPQRKT